MKNTFAIARRELFTRLFATASALGLAAVLPSPATAEGSPPAGSSGNATVRVILANGNNVQWMAVTNAGLTVGGQTALVANGKLNTKIVSGAIAAIAAAGGPKLTSSQVILLGGQV